LTALVQKVKPLAELCEVNECPNKPDYRVTYPREEVWDICQEHLDMEDPDSGVQHFKRTAVSIVSVQAIPMQAIPMQTNPVEAVQ
jgi:hypothetical protein